MKPISSSLENNVYLVSFFLKRNHEGVAIIHEFEIKFANEISELWFFFNLDSTWLKQKVSTQKNSWLNEIYENSTQIYPMKNREFQILFFKSF